jgi:hypothetical protein
MFAVQVRLLVFSVLMAACAARVPAVTSCDIFVSPIGRDDSPSPHNSSTPLGTLSSAAVLAAASSSASGAHTTTVCLLPGVYHETLSLGPDSGTGVVWQAVSVAGGSQGPVVLHRGVVGAAAAAGALDEPGAVLSGGVDVVFGPLGKDDPGRDYLSPKVSWERGRQGEEVVAVVRCVGFGVREHC